MPYIRAGVKSGLPPLALLKSDPEQKRSTWDMRLISAMFIIESYDMDGYPVWIQESRNVVFQVQRKIIPSLAAMDLAEKAASKKTEQIPGERMFAVPRTRDGKRMPRREDWLAARRGESHTAEFAGQEEIKKLEQRATEAEERAQQKMFEMMASDPEFRAMFAKASTSEPELD
jgi:hypothetical protein